MPGWHCMLHFCLPPLQSYMGWVSQPDGFLFRYTGFPPSPKSTPSQKHLALVLCSGIMHDRLGAAIEAPLICIWPILLSCALCNSAFWLQVRVISSWHYFFLYDDIKDYGFLVSKETVVLRRWGRSKGLCLVNVWNSSFSLSHYQTVKDSLTCYRLSTDDMMDPG